MFRSLLGLVVLPTFMCCTLVSCRDDSRNAPATPISTTQESIDEPLTLGEFFSVDAAFELSFVVPARENQISNRGERSSHMSIQFKPRSPRHNVLCKIVNTVVLFERIDDYSGKDRVANSPDVWRFSRIPTAPEHWFFLLSQETNRGKTVAAIGQGGFVAIQIGDEKARKYQADPQFSYWFELCRELAASSE